MNKSLQLARIYLVFLHFMSNRWLNFINRHYSTISLVFNNKPNIIIIMNLPEVYRTQRDVLTFTKEEIKKKKKNNEIPKKIPFFKLKI